MVKKIFEILPYEEVVYFGDTARCPYGPRSKRIVRDFSLQNVNFLLSCDVKFIVIACNTSSAFALDFLRRRYEVPMMGVVEPGAKGAVEVTKNNRVGVIGTVGTISSGSYFKAVQKMSTEISVYPLPCPLLVSLTEEGFLDRKATYLIAEEYLLPLKKRKIDTLILGCTHYPLLKSVIKRIMGKDVVLIDSAERTAWEVKRYLKENKLLRNSRKRARHKFFVSDQPDKFKEIGERFLGEKIKKVNLIDINKY